MLGVRTVERKIPRYLYHYTKIDKLSLIFADDKGKNIKLRFTDTHCLNDGDEGIYFYKFLNEHKEEIVGRFETKEEKEYCRQAINDFFRLESYRYLLDEKYGKHYSFPFSELRDSMFFWQAEYANENGIALRFCSSLLQDKCGDQITLNKVQYFDADAVEKFLPNFMRAIRQEVSYCKYQGFLDEDGTPFFQTSGANILARNHFWAIKSKAWEQEKEWRLIKALKALNIAMERRPKLSKQKTENVEKKGRFDIDEINVPRYYIDIPNPIDEIILGPSFSDRDAYSVEKYLAEHHYQGIKVSQSVEKMHSVL